MRIILIQDVPHLGSLGDEVQVKDGYARNYLLPKGMAMSAGSKNAAHIAHRRKRLEGLREQAIELAEAESEKVGNLELVVRAKAGTNGRLFGSVTNRDLKAALEELGYTVDRRAITLHAPIKSLGIHGATVKLHSEVKTDVSVKVVSMELTEEELRAEEEAAAEAAGEAPAEGTAGEAAAENAESTEGEGAASGSQEPAPEAAPEAGEAAESQAPSAPGDA
ncbi:MAG: 50S ribosomal protein L9 [SAR324 cluster bacterium]|nr:50S ribosomal protein L9 [SAR324 cluster bacterium]